MRFGITFAAAIIAVIFTAASPLPAGILTLTPAGLVDNFTLTTFATIDPGLTGNTGPFGIAVAANGTVLVNNFLDNTRYNFADVDGQTLGSALHAVPSNSSAIANATAGGQAYGGVNGQFVQFNPDGTVNHALTGVTETPWLGMWGNPVTGHILATTGQGQLIDIDPLANGGTGAATVVHGSLGLGYDGVSVSPDGAIAYLAINNRILGFNIASGAQVFDSGLLAGFPDGVGVIASNSALNGQLVINFNGPTLNAGFVGLLDPASGNLTVIASGGTRGDYAAPDPSNGTLFLDYSDLIYRLNCGPNCAIGQAPAPPPPAGTPEPATLGLVALSLAAIAAARRNS
ncbi:MAG: PEP-CTERM sorting domain-containing protein [Acidobacteriia bacterium]|nr:PEP-CTERM sorting domain-containing protein [Terriglobia bacterium]